MELGEQQKQKSRSVSFRIPEIMIESLETEATLKKISTSNLLTQILANHNDYLENAGRAGFVGVPRPLLTRLMEGYPEKQVIALADHLSKDTYTDIMSVLQNEYTVETFLKVIESWARASMMPFRLETKGGLNTCIIQHDLGKNWSLYLGHICKYVIEDLLQKKVKIETTAHTMMLKF